MTASSPEVRPTSGPAPAEAVPSDSASVEPDEPPSPGPSGSPSARPLTILTADERSGGRSDEVQVDLDLLASLLSRALSAEGAPAGAEASLTLVDPEHIAALKAEHLDGDGAPTDVLSFPIDGVPSADEPVDPTSCLVGDVVLCPEVAQRQAPDHAGTIEDELALLVVHSALHLAGWDHAAPADRDAMWARERELLSTLHHPPARDPWSTAPR